MYIYTLDDMNVFYMNECRWISNQKSDERWKRRENFGVWQYVMGPEPGRWCKFYKVKGHHTEDRYQLKKEIKRLIHEGHLKNYVKKDSSRGPDKSISRGRDDVGSYEPNKMDETPKDEGCKFLCHNPTL